MLPSILTLTLALIASCHQKHENLQSSSVSKADRVDSLLSAAVNNAEIPGAVAVIVRNGKTVYQKAFGYRVLENKTLMEEHDIFPWLL